MYNYVSDHFVCSYDCYAMVSDVILSIKLPSFHHLPVCCRLRLQLVFDLESGVSNDDGVEVPSMRYHWRENLRR